MKLLVVFSAVLISCSIGLANKLSSPSENEVIKGEELAVSPKRTAFREGKTSNPIVEEYTRISNTKARLKLQDLMMRNTIRKFLDSDPTVAGAKGIFIVKNEGDKLTVQQMLGREDEPDDEKLFSILMSDAFIRKLLGLNEHMSRMKAVLLVREEREKRMIEALLQEYNFKEQIMVISTMTDAKEVELIRGIVDTDKNTPPAQVTQEEEKKADSFLDDLARLSIKSFLESESSPESLGGLFLVQSTDARMKFEKLIAQDRVMHAMKELRLVQLEKAWEAVSRHVDNDHSLKGVNAILIVKNSMAKAAIEAFIKANNMKDEIMMVLAGEGEKANKIIDELINVSGSNSSSADPGLVHQKSTSARDDRVKRLMEDLLGQDDRLMQLLELFPNLDKKVRETIRGMIGHDDKVREIMAELSARNTLHNPGFLSQQERSQNILEKLYGKDDRGREVNDGLADEKVRRCGTEPYRKATQKTREELELFVRHLQRTYLLETVFDLVAFEASGKGLEAQLWALETKVAAVMVCDRDLAYQLAFAQHMFEAMLNAVELLKYYAGIEMPAHHLVYSMIDLSIRLLGLRNTHGDPDLSMDGFAIKVKQSVEMLHFWSGEFNNYDDVPFAMRKTFQRYSAQAEKSLLILAQHLADKQSEITRNNEASTKNKG